MWWQTLEPLMLYILLAVIAIVVLIIVILLIVCCCCCCRKKKDDKKKGTLLFDLSLFKIRDNMSSLNVCIANDKVAPQDSIDLQDDGEYENLPFHGMANAPNKVCWHSDNCVCIGTNSRDFWLIVHSIRLTRTFNLRNKSALWRVLICRRWPVVHKVNNSSIIYSVLNHDSLGQWHVSQHMFTK